jgi:hypothetical protein
MPGEPFFRGGALIGRETTSVVDEQHGLVMVEGAEMMKYGAPPAISRLLLSMAHVMAISRLTLVGWPYLELDHTRSSAWCGSAGRRTTMPSPGMTWPLATTMPMIPALRTTSPLPSRPRTALSRRGWKALI